MNNEEESTRNNHVLFSFCFRCEEKENKTGEYNTKTKYRSKCVQLSELVVDDKVETSDTDCCN
jgi:hypothetical protein